MSQSQPSAIAPLGLVYLPFSRRAEEGVTIRWRRHEQVAYVLEGRAFDDPGGARVLDRIRVSPSGWTDLAEVRRHGESWLREHLASQVGAR